MGRESHSEDASQGAETQIRTVDSAGMGKGKEHSRQRAEPVQRP